MKPARQAIPLARGSATVEFALCLLLVLMLLGPMLLLSRGLLSYHLLLRATRDAAYCVAAAPSAELANPEGRAQVLAAARATVQQAMDLAGATYAAAAPLELRCDAQACDADLHQPASVRVAFQAALGNPLLPAALSSLDQGYALQFDVTVPYAQ